MKKHLRFTNGKTGSPAIAIGMNSNPSPTPCALCGQKFDPVVGPELITVEAGALVCVECGGSREPSLRFLLEMARQADEYVFFFRSWLEGQRKAA